MAGGVTASYAAQSPQGLNSKPPDISTDPYFNPPQKMEASAPFGNYFKQAFYGLNETAIEMAANYINLMAGNKGGPTIHDAAQAEVEGEIMYKFATAFVSKATSMATMLFQMNF